MASPSRSGCCDFRRLAPGGVAHRHSAVVINPPRSSGPILALPLQHPIPYDSVRVGNDDHPFSSGSAVRDSPSPRRPSFNLRDPSSRCGLPGKNRSLAAGEVDGQRLVVMAFSPQLSDRLPLTASFPLLLGNAVLWVVEGSEQGRKRLQNVATGEFVDVEGGTITWTDWHDGRLRRRQFPLDSTSVEMTRNGIWETDRGMKGTSFLLSSTESDLPGIPAEDAARMKEMRQSLGGRFGSLIRILLLLIVIALLVESWLFHRHAVY